MAFSRAGALLGCELQFSGESPEGSAIVALRLLAGVRLVGCWLAAAFRHGGAYPAALAGAEAVAVGCLLELEGEVQGLIDG